MFHLTISYNIEGQPYFFFFITLVVSIENSCRIQTVQDNTVNFRQGISLEWLVSFTHAQAEAGHK